MRKLFNVRSSSREDKNSVPLNLRRSTVLAGLFFVALSIQNYSSASDQEQDSFKFSPVSSHQATGDIHESEPVYNSKKDSYYTTFELPPSLSLSPEKLVYVLPTYKPQKLIACMIENSESGDQEKIIHGKDRRKVLYEEVTNNHYNYNVYLEIYYANVEGKTRIYYGSGSLIAKNLILTAAHNLYDLKDGGYPDRIDCFVACYRDKVLAEATVFPKLQEGCIVIHPHYIKDEERIHLSSSKENSLKEKEETYIFSSYDIGLIVFNQEQVDKIKQTWPVMNFVRPIKIPNNNTREALLKKDFFITGYPGERKAYSMEGKLSDIDLEKNKICYDIDTYKGQSGSGICFRYNEQIHCAGVHTCAGNESEKFNIGVLIDDEINTLIRKHVLPH